MEHQGQQNNNYKNNRHYHYKDHSNESANDLLHLLLVDSNKSSSGGGGKNKETFPLKLHAALLEAESNGLEQYVSWQPHGRALKIHNPDYFEQYIMPRYFNQIKMNSFNRQLRLYGFRRIDNGPDKGGYYHELFLRGKIFLCHRMQRNTKIAAVGRPKIIKYKSSDTAVEEPNFYSMPYLPKNNIICKKEEKNSSSNIKKKNSIISRSQSTRSYDKYQQQYQQQHKSKSTTANRVINDDRMNKNYFPSTLQQQQQQQQHPLKPSVSPNTTQQALLLSRLATAGYEHDSYVNVAHNKNNIQQSSDVAIAAAGLLQQQQQQQQLALAAAAAASQPPSSLAQLQQHGIVNYTLQFWNQSNDGEVGVSEGRQLKLLTPPFLNKTE